MNQAQESRVSAEIEAGRHIEYQPLKGLITLTHDKNEKVDLTSFRFENKPLQVELIKETAVSSSTNVSFYYFTLPGNVRGLHKLSPITVSIGGKPYSSFSSTYEVGQLAVGEASSDIVLQFENIVEGSPSIYPGQRLTLGYRYTFSGDIELTEEKLPLLDAKGLLKVGAKAVKDFTNENLNVREVTQEVEGVKPGTYTFPPSAIVGNGYKEDVFGKRQYLQPPLQAGAESVTITVTPFPDKNKPASFNGAVGPFDDFKVSLLSPPQVSVGDKILLSIEIDGKGQLQNVPLPEICCQPGFSGQFKISDLPPVEELKGPNAKKFQVEMRLLADNIAQIPPLEFSYFEPEQQTYKTLHSQPIPLTVAAASPKKPTEPLTKEPPKQIDTAASHGDVAHQLAPIAINGNKTLTLQDLSNIWLGTWKVFWALPLLLVAWLLQLNYHKVWLEERKKIRTKTSQELWNEALQFSQKSPEFYRKIQDALLLKLKEKGHIAPNIDNFNNLPPTGIAGKVREFLLLIEEQRFTGHEQHLSKAVLDEAQTLFEEI